MFIGEKLDQRRLSNILDQCLLSDSEMRKWERVMRKKDDMSIKKEMLEQIFEGEPSLFLSHVRQAGPLIT